MTSSYVPTAGGLVHLIRQRFFRSRVVATAARGARRAAPVMLGVLLVFLASPASPSPIAGPSGFLTVLEAQALARAGALSWHSDREMVAAFFFDPIAGRAPTIHSRWSVLTADDDNRAVLDRGAFDRITCGRVQIDLEQYGANGLDYSTLLVLFVDTGIDCAGDPGGFTGAGDPQDPEGFTGAGDPQDPGGFAGAGDPRDPGGFTGAGIPQDPGAVTVVPEPSTWLLMGSGALIALGWRMRTRAARASPTR